MTVILLCGDCLDVLKTLEPVDAIVTDPPYGLGFMGKGWDHAVPSVEIWRECFRVLKPGGHLLAFAGTRTQHRMACAIEDAGFEIRDLIAWVYGTGFPKSLNVSKAIDKAAGAERKVVGQASYGDGHVQRSTESIGYGGSDPAVDKRNVTAAATEPAKQWEGWGTALKPALEPITVARKPLEGTVAANVQKHGTGAINVDESRVEGEPWKPVETTGLAEKKYFSDGKCKTILKEPHNRGRWPANLIHDGSEEATEPFPQSKSTGGTQVNEGSIGGKEIYSGGDERGFFNYGDSGSAARFFYCAKASKKERGEGNKHPTVKPIALMQYLCRLVTPPGGTVLDPFLGSGSTGIAAVREGFDFVGIELSEEYHEIATRRIKGDTVEVEPEPAPEPEPEKSKPVEPITETADDQKRMF